MNYDMRIAYPLCTPKSHETCSTCVRTVECTTIIIWKYKSFWQKSLCFLIVLFWPCGEYGIVKYSVYHSLKDKFATLYLRYILLIEPALSLNPHSNWARISIK